MKNWIALLPFVFAVSVVFGQADRWQQRVEYQMDITMNVENHQYGGVQKLTYHNNSPDRLDKVFYHLYFNAFQPGSMMDVRSLTIEDPDPRVGDRISKLSPEEQGWIQVKSLKMDGKKVDFETVGTILEVSLPRAIEPGSTVVFEMTWDAQVPAQVRRSGWNNAEGVEYSMTQWYPKMCEYDYEGWHSNPYVGREFHGVWGSFEVNITMPTAYTIGATGVLQNPNQVGHGYGDMPVQRGPQKENTTWTFKADNVHDFAWAADKDYVHESTKLRNGTVLHFIHQNDEEYNEAWRQLPEYMEKAFAFLSEHFGQYPYPQYTFIQGGDGGMEYPMMTLITGNRKVSSLVGVSVHEAVHSWYQGVLGSNESLYEWMDEGFTSYATSECMGHLFTGRTYPPHHWAFEDYFNIVREGKEEPLATHADHYTTNAAYGTAAYSKGEVLLAQLEYVIGREAVEQGLLDYFNTWKFKHPNPTDFKRVMEKASGIELDWYFEYFVNTTKTIDYGIQQVYGQDGHTMVTLQRVGLMPMPVDVTITMRNGSTETINIPMRIMRGNRPLKSGETLAEDWPWTNPTYELILDRPITEIERIEIDANRGMADVDRSNNTFTLMEGVEFIWKH
ncbi:MAG: M1 family metallopeptidase [Flavobacteriales bacterium]|nr:M1 family metallopeptidase [Flavobacteriales bacterium]